MHSKIDTTLLYRKRAEEAEAMAADARLPGIRNLCREIAEHWRDLADRMEHQTLDRRTWQIVRGLAYAAALNASAPEKGSPDGWY